MVLPFPLSISLLLPLYEYVPLLLFAVSPPPAHEASVAPESAEPVTSPTRIPSTITAKT